MARKILFAVHKGGAGKTTSAKNIGAALALMGKRVLIIDLDEQANITEGLGYDDKQLSRTVNDLFKDPSMPFTEALISTKIENLHLLPGHSDLNMTNSGFILQRTNPNASDPILTLREILEPVEQYYDYILIDTPPAINYLTINALAAADELIIPVAASAYNRKGLIAIIDAYERAKEKYNPGLKQARILVTRVKRTNAANNVNDIVAGEYGHMMLPQIIFEGTRVDEAEQLGEPVVTYEPNDPAAIGYVRLAELLENEQ